MTEKVLRKKIFAAIMALVVCLTFSTWTVVARDVSIGDVEIMCEHDENYGKEYGCCFGNSHYENVEELSMSGLCNPRCVSFFTHSQVIVGPGNSPNFCHGGTLWRTLRICLTCNRGTQVYDVTGVRHDWILASIPPVGTVLMCRLCHFQFHG